MHDLHISGNDRVISPFREDFIFTKLTLHMQSFAKIKPSRKFPNLQYLRASKSWTTFVQILNAMLREESINSLPC